eukprot:GHUV01022329.1.p3 GENE.GHUV01022329.1~~GHUV01022329.1.p3  ORF type:complete len:134 (+),score=19.70 GHUV01022329.1:1556-1957(+)
MLLSSCVHSNRISASHHLLVGTSCKLNPLICAGKVARWGVGQYALQGWGQVVQLVYVAMVLLIWCWCCVMVGFVYDGCLGGFVLRVCHGVLSAWWVAEFALSSTALCMCCYSLSNSVHISAGLQLLVPCSLTA